MASLTSDPQDAAKAVIDNLDGILFELTSDRFIIDSDRAIEIADEFIATLERIGKLVEIQKNYGEPFPLRWERSLQITEYHLRQLLLRFDDK